MNGVAPFLAGDAGLLALAVAAAIAARQRYAAGLVYSVAFAISAAMLIAALDRLLGAMKSEALLLPLGLPWLGTHFRIDALAAFFLVIVNLGGAAASLYGLGERREEAPERVLPFFPAFLAGMNLVLVADDAFVFLLRSRRGSDADLRRPLRSPAQRRVVRRTALQAPARRQRARLRPRAADGAAKTMEMRPRVALSCSIAAATRSACSPIRP
jgi:hypothetical protein